LDTGFATDKELELIVSEERMTVSFDEETEVVLFPFLAKRKPRHYMGCVIVESEVSR
jgi:hypothetical protein